MRDINKHKVFFFSALTVLLMTTTTCKKISKHSVNMNGLWFGAGSTCDLMIEIKANGEGSYYPTSGDKGCSGNIKIKGKVRYNNRKLYIGETGFKFITDPYIPNITDSVSAPEVGARHKTKRYKALATMRLKNNVFNSSQENTFIKYVEY